MRYPAFPFIDQVRGLGYMREKERKEKKKEKNRGEEGSGAASSFFSSGRVPLVNAVGDVSSQAWPITVTGRVKACLLPSWCLKSDPELKLSYM
jgi:hypothetical protein